MSDFFWTRFRNQGPSDWVRQSSDGYKDEGLAMRKSGDPIVKTSVKARAGFLDRPVLVVLVVSVVVALAALVISYVGVL